MPSLTVTLTGAPKDGVRQLIAELEDILSAEYLPEQRHGLPLEAIFQPHVRPAARGQGIARGVV